MNDQTKNEAGAGVSPLSRLVPIEDYNNLIEIAATSKLLCDAVTSRMSADHPTDAQVWAMLRAHKSVTEALSKYLTHQ